MLIWAEKLTPKNILIINNDIAPTIVFFYYAEKSLHEESITSQTATGNKYNTLMIYLVRYIIFITVLYLQFKLFDIFQCHIALFPTHMHFSRENTAVTATMDVMEHTLITVTIVAKKGTT